MSEQLMYQGPVTWLSDYAELMAELKEKAENQRLAEEARRQQRRRAKAAAPTTRRGPAR